ncbi:hypothetical protein LTR50_005519 [Elasticomyces elasticus]|nr:hypothetical protein LTR50_005519 [Elasticomyces elasticus]
MTIEEPNTLPPIHRFITTHDSTGKAVFSTSLGEESERKYLPDGTACFALSYTTKGFPVDLDNNADVDRYAGFLENAPGLTVAGGTVLRHVDLAPDTTSAMHRTVSLDYGVVLEGEVELLLDSGEKRLMRRGDVAVQRGTMHAWRNPSKDSWARMMYVLQPCKPLEVAGRKLGEDLETMQGVRTSD